MNNVLSPLANGAPTIADLRALGVKPEDIDSNWMDEMINRLFTELKRELSQLENSKPKTEHEKKDATVRATNARTLDSLQRTLERLGRMDSDRAARKASKGTLSAAQARARLEPRILEIFARIRSESGNGGDDR